MKPIIIIDDDYVNNFICESIIHRILPNCKLKSFISAKEALEYLSEFENNSHFILLDINMPEMNGWQFLDEMESISKAFTVFMLTSSVDPIDKEKADSYAMIKGFHSKPLSEDTVNKMSAYL